MKSKSISTKNHELTFEADTLIIKEYGRSPSLSTPKEISANERLKKILEKILQVYSILIISFWCLGYFQQIPLPNFLQDSPTLNFLFLISLWVGTLIKDFFLRRAIIKSIKYTEINHIIHKKSFWGIHTATICFNNTLEQGKIVVVFGQTIMHASTDWGQFKSEVIKWELANNKTMHSDYQQTAKQKGIHQSL
ncbi:MAG: hypothetical protein AB8B69_21370 [Chitinophagales bacterium]